ncbi:MAG TPA: PorT family protein [Flavobacterium sp.]|jgi:hypothetical protein
MRKLVFLVVLMASASSVLAQRRTQENNGIGIMFGANQANLETANFEVNPELGWNLGLQVRGGIYNDFYMVYSIQFNENNFSVPTINGALQPEEVKYKLAGGQISLQLSYSIIDTHLSVEAGPVFQFNGKMKVSEAKEGNSIKGTDLKVGDIVDVNPFNFHAAVGFTAGVKHVRLSVQYLYGISNVLKRLNEQNAGYEFEGRLGILSGNVVVFL